jgi:hypothetical protein
MQHDVPMSDEEWASVLNTNGRAGLRVVFDSEIRERSTTMPEPVDWEALYSRQVVAEWLVDDVWPVGRQLHIFAARKTGKSLIMLHMAACLAAGRDPFTGRPTTPLVVVYLDYEMSEDDLLERVEQMGFQPADLGNLRYYLWPALAPLDTPEGGRALLDIVRRDGAGAVVLDTVSRVVEGEENSNDTFRALYRNTGLHLKAEGVALARLDHEGHESGRSRGASAKADDVDVVWQLKATDDGLAFVKKAARMAWIPERVDLVRTDDPLGFRRVTNSWPAGTSEKALELDEVGAPLDVSKREARRLLTEAGKTPGRDGLLMKAITYRKSTDRLGGLL